MVVQSPVSPIPQNGLGQIISPILNQHPALAKGQNSGLILVSFCVLLYRDVSN
jgi:hypothetical protein